MRTTLSLIAATLAISCGGGKSGGGGTPGNPPVVTPTPVPSDDVETCLSARANLTSDLSTIEAQLANLQNAKDLAHGILRASCTKT